MADTAELELVVPAAVAAAISSDQTITSSLVEPISSGGLDSKLGTAVSIITLLTRLSQCANTSLEIAKHACDHASTTQTTFEMTIRGEFTDQVVEISPTADSKEVAHTLERGWTIHAELGSSKQ
jgi:hypothetical protein